MSNLSHRFSYQFPKFFITKPAGCHYLPQHMERKVYTELKGRDASGINESLGAIGFRRSQNIAYRPSCDTCSACRSMRVCAQDFRPSRSMRRIINNNSDLVCRVMSPWATSDHYDLFQRYIDERHTSSGMIEMDFDDYADMVECTPVSTRLYEYREPNLEDGSPGDLVGVSICDRYSDGLSMVYSFFDPAHKTRDSLGTYIILDHIERARGLGKSYVYLGYWIAGSATMSYKVRFAPFEILTNVGWKKYENASQAIGIPEFVDDLPKISGSLGVDNAYTEIKAGVK